MLRPGVHSRWPHARSFFLVDLDCTKEFCDFPFSTKGSGETVARRPVFRRSTFTGAPCSFFVQCPFFVAGVGLPVLFEVWNAVSCDRCRTSDTFSPARQALHFLHVAQTLAGVGPNERRFRSAVFGELGRLLTGLRVSFCEMVVVIDLALGHRLARHAQYFERFRFIFCGRPSTSETSTKKRS